MQELYQEAQEDLVEDYEDQQGAATFMRPRELGLFSLQSKKLRRNLTTVFLYLERVCRQWSQTLVRTTQQQSKRQQRKVAKRKFHLDIRKKFLAWGWLNIGTICPRWLWSLHLGDLQKSSEYDLEQPDLTKAALLWEAGWTRRSPEVPSNWIVVCFHDSMTLFLCTVWSAKYGNFRDNRSLWHFY